MLRGLMEKMLKVLAQCPEHSKLSINAHTCGYRLSPFLTFLCWTAGPIRADALIDHS